MRLLLFLAALPVLAACHHFDSAPPGGTSLTLNERSWERVNVELVITTREDCDSRSEGYVSTKTLVMHKNTTETIGVPAGATVCLRHDSDPAKPVAGAWSGWTRATPTGGSAELEF